MQNKGGNKKKILILCFSNKKFKRILEIRTVLILEFGHGFWSQCKMRNRRTFLTIP